MTIEGQKFYPGENASPDLLLQLADEYRLSANVLQGSGRRGQPLSRAPHRFLTIHAVELYLNAALLATGHSPAELRRMHHDLSSRVALAVEAGLTLRKRTLQHLILLSSAREYLSARYDPEAAASSQLNRLAATLAEVSMKVAALVARHEAAQAGPR